MGDGGSGWGGSGGGVSGGVGWQGVAEMHVIMTTQLPSYCLHLHLLSHGPPPQTLPTLPPHPTSPTLSTPNYPL